MKLPKGYTETEVLEVFERIATRIAKKFKFGYHEVEDMKQQIFLEILKPDKNGITILEKFDPEKGNSLDSFLWIHARNRLHNFKRDNYSRLDKPCFNCPLKAYKNKECTKYSKITDCEYYYRWFRRNEKKKTLIGSNNISNSEVHQEEKYSPDESLFAGEIYKLIDKHIPISQRPEWIKFTNKIKIPKVKREKLMESIIQILKENGIDEETW